MVKPQTLADAYAALGLEEGVSIEELKTTYKRVALRTHPDKNPNNPDATTEFQKVGEAYNILLKHLDTSRAPRGFSFGDFDDYDEDDYDEYDDYDDYDSEDDIDPSFYFFLFEHVMRGYSRSYSHARHRREHEEPRETSEQQAQRLRRQREEQEAAEERRKREAIARKERQEQDRQRERVAAEKRQKAKVESKKAQADAQRKKALDAARAQREKVQKSRSAVFKAARNGDAEKVKKGIWEDDVDAAGGEVKAGHEEFVSSAPKDDKETLLHIASRQGNRDLVEWLDAHSADVEERDSQNRTAVHVAVQHGHIEVFKYFLENHPPTDSDSARIYASSYPQSLLSFALESHEPEVVWMVLDKGLASSREIGDAWSWINSVHGKSAMKQYSKNASGNVVEKFDDIIQLLMRFGRFTPPLTPVIDRQDKSHRMTRTPSPHLTGATPPRAASSHHPQAERQQFPRGRGRRGRGRGSFAK